MCVINTPYAWHIMPWQIHTYIYIYGEKREILRYSSRYSKICDNISSNSLKNTRVVLEFTLVLMPIMSNLFLFLVTLYLPPSYYLIKWKNASIRIFTKKASF